MWLQGEARGSLSHWHMAQGTPKVLLSQSIALEGSTGREILLGLEDAASEMLLGVLEGLKLTAWRPFPGGEVAHAVVHFTLAPALCFMLSKPSWQA